MPDHILYYHFYSNFDYYRTIENFNFDLFSIAGHLFKRNDFQVNSKLDTFLIITRLYSHLCLFHLIISLVLSGPSKYS